MVNFSYMVSSYEKLPASEIVDCAFKVHKQLGPGLLEKIYETCLCHELGKKGIHFKRQVDLPIVYDSIIFDEGLRIDVLVEDIIIVELKAVDTINPGWQAQVLNHLKLVKLNTGFLINYNVPTIEDGIKRYML